MRRETRLLTLSAVLCALGVALVSLAALLPTLQLALAALAGLLCAMIVLCGGVGRGLMLYAATSVLVLLISPDKGAAAAYVLLFGHWPVVKSVVERRIHNRVLEWACKMAFAALLLTVLLLLSRVVVFDFFEAKLAVWMLYAGGLIAFALYDICFTGLVSAFGGKILGLFNGRK